MIGPPSRGHAGRSRLVSVGQVVGCPRDIIVAVASFFSTRSFISWRAGLPVVTIVCLLAEASPVHAGADNASLSCQSSASDKKVRLEGEIPGDFTEFSLTLARDTRSVEFSDAKDQVFVVENFARGVFTLVVASKEKGDVYLYALPRTVKARRRPDGVAATFDAVLMSAPDPARAGAATADSYLHNVKLRCTYVYAI